MSDLTAPSLQVVHGGTGFDISAYPHILDAILDNAPYGALLRLRQTCRALQEHVDRRLASHVVFLGRGSLDLHIGNYLVSADGHRIPQLSGTRDDAALPVPRLQIQVLDMTHRPPFKLIPTVLQFASATLQVVRTFERTCSDFPRLENVPAHTYVHFAAPGVQTTLIGDMFSRNYVPASARKVVLNINLLEWAGKEDKEAGMAFASGVGWRTEYLSLGLRYVKALDELVFIFSPLAELANSKFKYWRTAQKHWGSSVIYSILELIIEALTEHDIDPPHRITFVDLPEPRLVNDRFYTFPPETARWPLADFCQSRVEFELLPLGDIQESIVDWLSHEFEEDASASRVKKCTQGWESTRDWMASIVEFLPRHEYKRRAGKSWPIESDPSVFERVCGAREGSYASRPGH